MIKALILAGGLGERLRPYTEKIPKPLIEVAGRPILFWQIDWLKKNGVKNIVLAVGYLGEKIEEAVGKGEEFGVNIEYSYERKKLGTGGAIKNASEYLANTEKFLVINGDIITNLNVGKIIDSVSDGIIGAIALVPLPSPYGIVEFSEQTGLIKRFVEKPLIRDYWINAGVYCLTPKVLEYLPEEGDIEKTAFPRLAEEGKLKAVRFEDVLWKSVDTHKDIKQATKLIEEHIKRE